MPFFSKVFKGKEGPASSKSKKTTPNGAVPVVPPKPRWDDAWMRKDVEVEEIQELLRGCTSELKSRALDVPFLLLPFRPASDPSAARTFIRNFFTRSLDRSRKLEGESLAHELRLTEPLVLCSVMKWCWSRLAGGVVTWEAYELFRIGEQDSNMARDAFATFIPISVESDARTKIIFDFFDLMAAIAAHGKTNGMGGRKLSRLAGWWAFEHVDTGNGFDGGYKSWASAADATSHLFFAYLRSLSPDSVRGINGISALPLSLQTLVKSTSYPPERRTVMQTKTTKVAMIVDAVSPTPFALLRRAKHFEYRDDDQALQQFSSYDDPIQALTDECRRVLKSISSANDSSVSNSKDSTSLRDASWSRFEDVGFGELGDNSHHDDDEEASALGRKRQAREGLRSTPRSKNDFGRPTTPSWADFMSSGFVEEPGQGPAPLMIPSNKVLPPIQMSRGASSPGTTKNDTTLEPGELASITSFDLDDTFWWVWITSLAGEESTERKGSFGRCALIETDIQGGRWLIMEELVKGAAPEPEMGAYIAEKKSRFGFSTKSRMNRNKSSWRKPTPEPKLEPFTRSDQPSPLSKTSIAPDQHARIQAAEAALQQKNRQNDDPLSPRRARMQDGISNKTSSIFTLQPVIMTEAAPAMKWANSYDKNAIRAAYLGNNFAGKGSATELLSPGRDPYHNAASSVGSVTPKAAKSESALPRQESYGFPKQSTGVPREDSGMSKSTLGQDRDLPSIPHEEDLTSKSKSEETTPVASLAPLPIKPHKDIQFTNQAAIEAAEVPLPSTTPMEHPSSMERKPLPPPKEDREEFIEEPAQISTVESTPDAVAHAISPTTSPESRKSAGKKLKKRNASGFKGLFGRKKSEIPISPVPMSPSDNSTAVAAARAALHGPQKTQQNHNRVNPPQQQSTVGRRFSGIGRKKTPNHTPIVIPQAPAPIQDVDENPPVSTAESNAVPSQPDHSHQYDYPDSEASISRVDSNEERHANREFGAFDQGPLEDQPAFVPEDSPIAQTSSHWTTRPTSERPKSELSEGIEPAPEHELEQESHQERAPKHAGLSMPMSYYGAPSADAEPEQNDNVSDKSLDLTREISPVQDRWAQIRKNAAERAAARVERPSEEQSRQTDRTDEGDTSGEETIESRVARIRARVAELTGSMEGPNASRR